MATAALSRAVYIEKRMVASATALSKSRGASPICSHTASAAAADSCSLTSSASQASRKRAALESLVRANRVMAMKLSRPMPNPHADAIVSNLV